MRRIVLPLIALAALTGAALLLAGSRDRSGTEFLLARVGHEIAAREYDARADAAGLQAPNRAHGLRSRFEPAGLRLEERTSAAPLLSLRLAAMGRPGALADVAPGRVTGEGARVEIRRDALVEWYLNSPAGLEQGFTLEARPGGEGLLVLALALGGAEASGGGDALALRTHSGRTLAYGKLAVQDAGGAALPIHVAAVAPERIELRVDDRGARYPIVIDPLLTATWDTQLHGYDEGAAFGAEVSGAGDVNGDGFADLIVGAPDFDACAFADSGAAFIFLGSAEGIESGIALDADATLASCVAGDRFGAGVSGAGDVNGDGYGDVIVGATGASAAFVFLGGASGVDSTADAQLDSSEPGDRFGASVAGAGDVDFDGYADVVVGAPGHPPGGGGAAFVFRGGPAGVASASSAAAHAQVVSDQPDAALGASVAGAGDVNGDGFADVIVGAPLRDGSEGAAYVFHGSVAGVASGGPSAAAAVLDGDAAFGELGRAVAGAGDVDGDGYGDVLVGAPRSFTSVPFAGSAYVFHGGASGVGHRVASAADARIDGDQIFGEFGAGVSGAGDVNGDGYAEILIGAPDHDLVEQEEGAAFVFLGGSTGVSAASLADAHAALGGGEFGARLGSVAWGDVNGDGNADVLAGAPSAYPYPGSALVSLGAGDPLADAWSDAEPDATIVSDPSSNVRFLGHFRSSAGDVNGDGFDDLAIGAARWADFTFQGLTLFVFHGSAQGVATSDADANTRIDLSLLPSTSIERAGDVDGDGYGDLILGAKEDSKVLVFHGSASGLELAPRTQVAWSVSGNQLGAQVGSAGDVNGDGYGDVFATSSAFGPGQVSTAFVFHGGPSGIASGLPAAVASTQLEGFAGDVAPAGDVDADGFGDLVIGSPLYNVTPLAQQGAAFLFRGGAAGIASSDANSADVRFVSNQNDSRFGDSVAGVDVNGDGYSDVIIGAPRWDGPLIDNRGGAFVFHGGPTLVDGGPATADTRLVGAGSEFGWSVQPVGDLDADGFADLAVHTIPTPSSPPPGAWLYRGRAGGIPDGGPDDADGFIALADPVAFIETPMLGSGDLDGDGFGDLFVWSNPLSGDLAYRYHSLDVYYGKDVPRGGARQRRLGGAPLAPLGRSEAGFAARLVATHPQGRGAVKLQVEACPLLVPFGDPGCRVETGTSWSDSGTGGEVEVAHALTDVSPGAYRWRGRVLRAPLSVLLQGGASPVAEPGPWRRPGARSAQVDVRVVPEPAASLSLVSGVVLLGALARRRRAA